ncbi:hypothetical protein HMPREF3170_03655 [Corynebacterium sp. HMSC08D02]|uniref:hypothetical protein n=1 Tax=Corynebacterium sp. HMSC08D02 TaxID=1581138 RepID=UPI0008A2E81E|nr:hypothetical protein [Corynebacterium sp. HMSC08D02]OFT30617.1 hypothetical protein HMPREF3170_03655 [Corynebacterium sp. HMSC08D02]
MKTDDWTAVASAVGVLGAPFVQRHRVPFEQISPSAAHVRATADDDGEPTWKTVVGGVMIVATLWAMSIIVWAVGGAA